MTMERGTRGLHSPWDPSSCTIDHKMPHHSYTPTQKKNETKCPQSIRYVRTQYKDNGQEQKRGESSR